MAKAMIKIHFSGFNIITYPDDHGRYILDNIPPGKGRIILEGEGPNSVQPKDTMIPQMDVIGQKIVVARALIRNQEYGLNDTNVKYYVTHSLY